MTRRSRTAAALVVTLVGAAALGAYADWVLWHPMEAFDLYLAGAALLFVALIVAAIPRPAVRQLSLYPLAAAVGLFLGAWFGPSRPALLHEPAVVAATLARPALTSGEGRGSCETAGGSELQVAGSLRLQIRPDDPSAPADIDQREFVSFYLTVGERWRGGAIRRSDDVDLTVIVGSVEVGVPEVALAADDESLIELDWTADGGRIHFDRLVVDPSRTGTQGAPVDLAGTITWSCGERLLPPGAAEIAETVCAKTSGAWCVEDLLMAMEQMPGALVAVCEYADGSGTVVQLEREEDAAAWCPAGRVLEVLQLPQE